MIAGPSKSTNRDSPVRNTCVLGDLNRLTINRLLVNDGQMDPLLDKGNLLV